MAQNAKHSEAAGPARVDPVADGKANGGKTGVVLEGVSYRRGALTLLERQSLHVPSGESLAIIGANGVGKSTLLQLCAGLLEPRRGRVLLDGVEAWQASPSTLMRKGIVRAVVFQHGGLVADLSALENVMLPLRYHADLLKLDEDTIRQRARVCLGDLEMTSPDIHALPSRLSYGMRRRVSFARALAVEPRFVFLDDPDAGLDHDNAERIVEMLLRYRDDNEVTLLFTTNRKALLERLEVPVVELAEGYLGRPDLHTQPPQSLV